MTRKGRSIDISDIPDPLSRKDRGAMAGYTCNVCRALLLLVEIGPHYRINHPDARPSVSERRP